MLLSALSGFGAGLSLIVAIGAQNAFVLRQGLRRLHVGIVVAICAGSDLVLILAGVAGTGRLLAAAPGLITAVRWLGAAFLLGYGLLAVRRAVRGGTLSAPGGPDRGPLAAAATCLALTWLNPHVYLDTVVLLGALAATHGPAGRWWFAAGAGLASVGWFTVLGFGARHLAPVFARPGSWRILDAAIAVIMIGLATALVLSG